MLKSARQTALLWLLVLGTALWGATVADHLHLEPDHGLCDICVLPHAGNIAQPEIQLPPSPAIGRSSDPVPETPPLLFRTPYHSRAPPA
jgi:hypothetical protein